MRRTSRKGLLQGLTYCFLGDEMVLIYFFPAQIWGFQNHCPSLSLWGSGQHPLCPWISLNQLSLSRQVWQTPGPGQLTALSAAPKAHTVSAREQIIESCDDMFSPGTQVPLQSGVVHPSALAWLCHCYSDACQWCSDSPRGKGGGSVSAALLVISRLKVKLSACCLGTGHTAHHHS